MEKADKTHFVFKLDDGRKIDFIENREVHYAEVVSDEQLITIMIRLKGGERLHFSTHVDFSKQE